jgi:tryptophan-rich sensory protein
MYMTTLRTVGIFLICIAASLLAGFWGSTGTVGSIAGWYSIINKPFWTPPNWVFMPVWTLLYILMGTSVALVWKSARKGILWPVAFFFVHLLVNAYWSMAFFGQHQVELAVGIISVMWVMIAVMMVWFWKYSRLATYLLVPYLVWVTYATTLNIGVMVLN